MNWLDRLWMILMIDTDDVNDDNFKHRAAPRMNFMDALALLSTGEMLAGDVWTEIDFIFLVNGSEFNVDCPPLLNKFERGTQVGYKKHIDSMYIDGTIGVWTLSQRDIFANDWYIK